MEQLELARRHPGVDAGHALAGALVVGIADVMLGGGGDEPFLLEALGHLDPQLGHEEGILAVDLLAAAPPLVAPDVEDRRVDIRVAEGAGLARRDAPHLAQQVAVPRVAEAQLGGEAGGAVGLHAADALVGHVRGDAQARLLHEEALHLVDRPGVAAGGPDVRVRARRLAPLDEAVEVLVDRADAILPQPLLPGGRGQVVGQDTAIAIERYELAGLLLQRHLAQQILHPRLHVGLGVLVDVLAAVLVEVDPAHPVQLPLRGVGRGDGLTREDGQGGEGEGGGKEAHGVFLSPPILPHPRPRGAPDDGWRARCVPRHAPPTTR